MRVRTAERVALLSWLLFAAGCAGAGSGAATTGAPSASAAPDPGGAPRIAPRLYVAGRRGCVLRSHAELWCWGEGIRPNGASADETSSTAAVRMFPDAGRIMHAGVSRGRVCANTERSGILCTAGDGLPRTKTGAVAAMDTDCVLTTDGRVFHRLGEEWRAGPSLAGAQSIACSGEEGRAVMADGTGIRIRRSGSALDFTPDAAVADAASVEIAGDAVCFRQKSGELRCEGADAAGATSYASRDGLACAVRDEAVTCRGGSEPRGVTLGDWTRVAGTTGAVGVAVGDAPCALLKSEGVVCWGNWPRYQPVEVKGLGDVVAVDVSSKRAHAVTSSGDGSRWGRLVSFSGIDRSSALPEPAHEVTGLLDVSGHHALDRRGTVYQMYGDGRFKKELGVADAVELVSATFSHACARRRDGSVVCWGRGRGRGERGEPRGAPPTEVGFVVSGLTDARAVAVGVDFSCALRASGEVVCWGRGDAGALGIPSANDSHEPVKVPSVAGAVSVAASEATACAATRDGSVHCWGKNLDHLIDRRRDPQDVLPPTRQPVDGAVGVFLGKRTACAIVAEGRVSCWGARSIVTLAGAGGGAAATSTPPEPRVLPGLRRVDQLSLDFASACALARGKVLCWGENDHGQIGDGSGLLTATPVPGLDALARVRP